MATINLDVELESLTNDELDGLADKFYEYLAAEGRKIPAPFPGVVVNVSEGDREEDENEKEE